MNRGISLRSSARWRRIPPIARGNSYFFAGLVIILVVSAWSANVARTPSTMLPLGTKLIPFQLTDTEGRVVAVDGTTPGEGFLVMFICNHCPFVKHLRSALASVSDRLLTAGVKVFGINSNDVEHYPDDHPELMRVE